MKKYLFLLLAILPTVAWADEIGTCGESVTWTYVEATKTLTISGSGVMNNYDSYGNYAPWYNSYRSSIQTITIEKGVTSIGEAAFYYCSALSSISIPNSVTSIGQSAFYYCSALSSISIPNSVTSIGINAFAYCSSLTSIAIPNSVTSIGVDAFINTGWYNKQPDGLVYAGLVAYCYKGTMPPNTNVIVNDGTRGIAGCAFRGCEGLSSITIPNSVTTIGDEAFWSCTSLTSISLPNSMTSIGRSAFYNCPSLTSITIPNSVTSIDGYVFYGCRGLTSITIPNSVTSIGYSAFESCRSLTSITIPNSVTSIGNSAFKDCRSLTSITIPNSVMNIEGQAFQGCSGLTTITSYMVAPPIVNATIFPDQLKTAGNLYIPSGTRQLYVEKGWSLCFANIIEMEEGEPIWLSIIDAEQGNSKLKCEAGKSYTFRFEASDGWRVHSVSFRGADVTSWLTEESEFTTPAMSASSDLIVTYEQGTDDVKAFADKSDLRVVVINDEIMVKNAQAGIPIHVYDLSGRLISNATAVEGTTSVQTMTSEKVVIVKVGDRSIKVALK